jgi:hypothetical protein
MDGVIVSVPSSIVLDPAFESWSRQIKDYKLGMCCISSKQAVRRNTTDCLGIRIVRRNVVSMS